LFVGVINHYRSGRRRYFT